MGRMWPALPVLPAVCGPTAPAEPPNVVVVLADARLLERQRSCGRTRTEDP